MIAIVGKTLLYVLTVCALVSMTSQLIRGPSGGYHAAPIAAPELPGHHSPHCNYLQFAQKGDSTFWEDVCTQGAHPWDTVVIVRPDP